MTCACVFMAVWNTAVLGLRFEESTLAASCETSGGCSSACSVSGWGEGGVTLGSRAFN